MSAAAPGQRPWLHGPASDLLLGCGGLFACVFAAAAIAGPERFGALPLLVPALLTYLLGMPHYGATLVRVYDQREDRRAYALFSVWATLALAALFAAALSRPFLASVAFTVYLTWSPWHYSGQNYGIAVMFLRRRGVPLAPATTRWLRASFTLSFLLVLVLLHVEDPARGTSARDVRLLPVGIPAGLGGWLFRGALGLYAVATLAFLGSALRVARWRDLTPTLLVVLTQLLWFALPYGMSGLRFETDLVPLDREQRSAFFLWIAAGHALQYLWITSYYARSAASWRGTTRYLVKVLAAGTAIWTLPALLAAPPLWGLSELSGFVLLLAAVVNLHHFVLDGAIWKLRHGKVARVLIASDVAGGPEATHGGLRKLAWGIAGAGALAAGLLFWLETLALPEAVASQQPREVVRHLDALAWFQRDDADRRLWAARRLEQEGAHPLAMAQYRRSIELEPSIGAYTDLVRIHYNRGDAPTALAHTCRKLFELLPDGGRELEVPGGDAVEFDDAASTRTCFRRASLWRRSQASEVSTASAAKDPTTGRTDASVALGY